MVLTAVRGALGFLSRIPVGRNEAAWERFAATPVAFPLAGYVLGVLLVLPLLLPAPDHVVAFLFVAWLYLVTGITHVDGVADLGDAVAVHGDAAERRAVMKDAAVGTGGVLAVALVVLGLGTAGMALSGSATGAVLLVVTAEVGAKTGMATLVCLGSPAHDGLGSTFTADAHPRSLVGIALAAAPAVLLAPAALLAGPAVLLDPTVLVAPPGTLVPMILPGVAALSAALGAALLVFGWARANLGGVSGDVLGAANELARVAALHAGVIAWTGF